MITIIIGYLVLLQGGHGEIALRVSGHVPEVRRLRDRGVEGLVVDALWLVP